MDGPDTRALGGTLGFVQFVGAGASGAGPASRPPSCLRSTRSRSSDNRGRLPGEAGLANPNGQVRDEKFASLVALPEPLHLELRDEGSSIVLFPLRFVGV